MSNTLRQTPSLLRLAGLRVSHSSAQAAEISTHRTLTKVRSFSPLRTTVQSGSVVNTAAKMDEVRASTVRAPELSATEIQQLENVKIDTAAPQVTTISSSAGANVKASLTAINPYEIYRNHIAGVLSGITGVDAPTIAPKLLWAPTQDKGDLNFPVPSLRIKGNPQEQAVEWASKWPKDDEMVHAPTVTGSFLSFFFKPAPLTKMVITEIRKEREAYGSNARIGLKDPNDPAKGKKQAVVEFSSPNIAKPFHAGHLRSTIIGGFISNLYENFGWDVVRINYLGDWGRQFGQLAIAFEAYGSEEALQKDPINHLFNIYVKINQVVKPQEDAIKALDAEIKAINDRLDPPKPVAPKSKDSKAPPPPPPPAPEPLSEAEREKLKQDLATKEAEKSKIVAGSENEKARKFFSRMEQGDEQALALWRRFRDLSIDRYKKTYSRLNIRYDVYGGESFVGQSTMDRVLSELKAKGLSEESKGAVIVDFTKNKATKKLEKAVIQKTDGSSLYLTRELGELLKRWETYHPDKLIYVIASQQDLHVAQTFKMMELMGYPELAERCLHLSFGMVAGMSTRKGTVKFLDDILRDVGDYMHDVMRKNEAKYVQVEDPDRTADLLGISAVMIQDMSAKRVNGYEFDLGRMTSFEGDTGPYLQYAHARLCSIARKANLSDADLESADLSLLNEPSAIGLVRELAKWPDILVMALKNSEPSTIITYLFAMTHKLSSSYDILKVVGSDPELSKARMALYDAARQTLNNGMKLLGLDPVERM